MCGFTTRAICFHFSEGGIYYFTRIKSLTRCSIFVSFQLFCSKGYKVGDSCEAKGYISSKCLIDRKLFA